MQAESLSTVLITPKFCTNGIPLALIGWERNFSYGVDLQSGRACLPKDVIFGGQTEVENA